MSKSLPKRANARPDKSRRATKGLTRLTDTDEERARSYRPRAPSELKPLNEKQAAYIETIRSHALTFGIGPAGTGKTYIATSLAVDAFMEGKVDRIIITRPVVEAGEALGFLPGEIEEKFAPYLAPVRQILEKRMGFGAVEMLLKNGKIECLPFAYMRGHTLDRAFVLLDEAQNTTPTQMKMFLTRIGDGCRVVVDGDLSQKDIQGPSGLADALRRLGDYSSIGFTVFGRADVVRSGLVAQILRAYDDAISDVDRIGLERFVIE